MHASLLALDVCMRHPVHSTAGTHLFVHAPCSRIPGRISSRPIRNRPHNVNLNYFCEFCLGPIRHNLILSMNVVSQSATAEVPTAGSSHVLRPDKRGGAAYSKFLGAALGKSLGSPERPRLQEDEEEEIDELILVPAELPLHSEDRKMSAEEERQQVLKVRRSWLEGEEAKAQAGDANSSGPTSHDSFIAASSFGGARPGYVFKHGKSGMGYYADHKTIVATTTSAARPATTFTSTAQQVPASDARPVAPKDEDDDEEAAALRAALSTSASLPAGANASQRAAEAAWAKLDDLAVDISEAVSPESSPKRPAAVTPPKSPKAPPAVRTSPERPPPERPVLAAARTPEQKAKRSSSASGSSATVPAVGQPLVVGNSVLEFGSMRVADDDESSEDEDEEPLSPAPPGGHRVFGGATGARVGDDDSDGEVEFG